ncbi:TRAP transporter large permease [Desertibaculum subflavum]|uniref:TRAP transporter large permease n=1 Tax=Desertibaculum subflavum TaxID=2268458 RepID=UPI000E6626FD
MIFLLVLAGLILLLYTGMPMFAGMLLFSVAGLLIVEGNIASLGEVVFGNINSPLLVAIPLFMLMAHFMVRGRVVDDLYATAHTLVRHLPGGLGVATVFACAIFAAISGSSVATALTIGAVAIPQMLKYGYSPRGAYGVVAGGGTLGILIPPSAPMILYGFVADTSIGALFLAGVLPGLLVSSIFAAYCMLTEGWRERHADPPRPRLPAPTLAEAAIAIRRSFWALTLPPFVLGGIYFGVFTPTEAAGTGALWALVIAALVYRQMGWRDLWSGGVEAARTSGVLFMIIVGAALFGYMLTKLNIPRQAVDLALHYQVSQVQFLIAMMVLIFILGLILESISIILITTPVVLPVLDALGIDKIWYGVLLTINLELALISPPVGMNLIVIKSITKAPLSEIDKAAVPYILMLILALALIIAFPGIATWLPSTTQFGQ